MPRKPAAAPTTTLNIRDIQASHARHIKGEAARRGLTIAQYLGRVVLLTVAVEEHAREDAATAKILSTLGLEPVAM